MNDEEIELICRSALEAAPAIGKHPLNLIHELMIALCDTRREFDDVYLKCHKWLFEHRQEIPFSISEPSKTS